MCLWGNKNIQVAVLRCDIFTRGTECNSCPVITAQYKVSTELVSCQIENL